MVPEPVTISVSAFEAANTLVRTAKDIFDRYKEAKELPEDWASALSDLDDVENMLEYVTYRLQKLQSEGANLSSDVRDDMVCRIESVRRELDRLPPLLDKLRNDLEVHTSRTIRSCGCCGCCSWLIQVSCISRCTGKRQSLHRFFKKDDIKACLGKVSNAVNRAKLDCYFLRAELTFISIFSGARSFPGGDVRGLAYAQVGDESHLLSGGEGGSLWEHDARHPGWAARELTGHDRAVTSVVSADRGAGGDAAGNVLAASCSRDGTVRLWGCEHVAGKGELRPVQTLETRNRDWLECVDLTPDAARVVAGGRGSNCLHVWTRRSAGAAADAGGAGAYAAVALSGHRGPVSAVAVSRTGERVVSASWDGTVRIWRVARDAGDRPSHKLVSWANGKSRLDFSLALAADAQTVYVPDRSVRYRSDIAVVDCESAREVAVLQSDSVDSEVFSLALLQSSGGGANGRLFAGHENGVISEWDLASRTCSAVYGDPQSRAGPVLCITARFLDQDSDAGDAVARFESTRAGPRVTGAGAGTGGGALCDAGQSRVEFAAGYVGGAVRVWRASSGHVSSENFVAEAWAGVGERAMKDAWPTRLRRPRPTQSAPDGNADTPVALSAAPLTSSSGFSPSPASDARSAEGDIVEDVPVVELFFLDGASDALKDGIRVYAYLASDIYYKQHRRKETPPRNLIDFRGCEEPILLSRLADGKTRDDVETAVAYGKWPSPGAEAFPRPGLRIRREVRERGESMGNAAGAFRKPLSDVVLLFSPGSEDLCLRWTVVLRLRITPLALRREQVLESFQQSHPDPPSTAYLLKELQSIYEKENGEQESSLESRKGPDGNLSAAAIVERSEVYMVHLTHVREKADLAKSTAEGIANVNSASDVADVTARVLGGVALIAPVVSVAGMCIGIERLVAQVHGDRYALADLFERIPRISLRLSQILFILLRAPCNSRPPEAVDDAFDAIQTCWMLFNKVERHLLMNSREQALQTEHVSDMKEAAKDLEGSLRFAIRDKSIVEILRRIRELEDEMGNRALLAKGQRPKAYVGCRMEGPVVMKAIPRYEDIRQSLTVGGGGMIALCDSDVTVAASAEVDAIPVAAVNGDGGYGKTACLKLLANDNDVRDVFSYVIFIELGQSVSEEKLVEDLATAADCVCYGRDIGLKIRNLSKGPTQVKRAVDILQPILSEVRTLVILDNVWPRLGSGESDVLDWTSELANLVNGSSGGAVLFSTRNAALANGTHVTTRFKFGRVEDEAAIEIVKKHAGKVAIEAENAALFDSIAREVFLRVCDGWPLPLAVCGNLFRKFEGEWETLRTKLKGLVFVGKADNYPLKLNGLIRTTLQSAEERLKSYVECDRPLFLENDELRKEFLSMKIVDLYARLAVLSSRQMPTFALGLLFGVSDEVGEAAATVLGDFGLATILEDKASTGVKRSSSRTLVLHDLQHEFAVNRCSASTTGVGSSSFDGAMSVSEVHRLFAQAIATRFCEDAESCQDAVPQWSRLCENEDARQDSDNLATYACENVVHHLAESAQVPRDLLREDEPFGPQWFPRSFLPVLWLLCSYPWIRERGNAFGRAGVLRDLVTATAAIRHDDENAARRGALHALTAILTVLQLISHEAFRQYDDTGHRDSSSDTSDFISDCDPCSATRDSTGDSNSSSNARDSSGDGESSSDKGDSTGGGGSSSDTRDSTGDGDSSTEAFTERGIPDSGLAGELYGRLAVIEFERVDDAARPFALQVAGMLQASIRESARPPWLCPRNDCYLSSERSEDERCFAAISASGGVGEGVAYARVGDESLLLSGGAGGSLWVHDARDPGGPARELTGHGDDVTSVVAAGRGADGAAGNVLAATCSLDGTVRLWGCENGAAKGEVRALQTLETSDREEVECVDLTPDAARVVAGGQRSNYVHVWTRRSAGAAAAARGADAYAAIALSGHMRPVTAVAVSRTGERVVSASAEDGTVRVWRVAMDAADGSSHRLVSWADDDCDEPRLPTALALAADGLTLYVADWGRSDIALVDCESSREVAALQSDSVGSAVLCLALLNPSGGSASGRLFAGHGHGVISEWDLAARTCSAVYGDPQSRAGFVTCITARFLEQPSDGGDMVARSESTRAGPRVTGAAAGTGGGVLCGARQSRVEFAARYLGGAVRVWRASSGYGSCENSAAEAGAGVGEREVERHVDTQDDAPWSLAASGDGRWLVSGSHKGVLCVWDTGSGACVATVRGHEGIIMGIDVSGDGTVIASCSRDGTARVWTLQRSHKWRVLANLDHQGEEVVCIVMTADTLHAITGDDKGHVRVWNTSTGELCGCGRDKHSRFISSLAVLQGGAARSGANLVFASRGKNGTCILWSLRSEGDLACEKEVSDVREETDLGTVFSSCEKLAPLPALWHEQRGGMSDANHFVFSGGGCGGTRRYEIPAKYSTVLRVLERENDSRAAVGLDSTIFCLTSFQRQEDGAKRLVVCCGLENGIVAMFDLIPRTA